MSFRKYCLLTFALSFVGACLFGHPCAFAQGPDRNSIHHGNEWIDPDHGEPAGTHYHLYATPSRGVGTQASCLIYLPPGYEKNANQRFPVLYWLHGGAGSQREQHCTRHEDFYFHDVSPGSPLWARKPCLRWRFPVSRTNSSFARHGIRGSARTMWPRSVLTPDRSGCSTRSPDGPLHRRDTTRADGWSNRTEGDHPVPPVSKA